MKTFCQEKKILMKADDIQQVLISMTITIKF